MSENSWWGDKDVQAALIVPERRKGSSGLVGPNDVPDAWDTGQTGMEGELGNRKFLPPTAMRLGVGLAAGGLTSLAGSPALGIPLGAMAGEAAGQFAELYNKNQGATNQILTGPSDTDLRLLNATANMLMDATGGLTFSLGGKVAAKLSTSKYVRPGLGGHPSERMADFEAAGIKPSAGDVSQNRFLQGIEFADSRLFSSQGAMRKFRQEQVNALQKNFAALVERGYDTGASVVSQRTPFEIGQQTLQRLANKPSSPFYEQSYFKGFRETNKRARENMMKSIDESAIVDYRATSEYLNGNRAIFDSPEMRSFAIPNIIREFEGAITAEAKTAKGLTWKKFDLIHQQIGARLDQTLGLPGEEAAALNQLYKVMYGDLTQTAERMGGGAKIAWQQYDKFYGAAKAIEDDLVKIIQSQDPEKIFKAVDSTKRWQTIEAALTPGQFNDFRAAKIVDMGRWNPDIAQETAASFKVSTWSRNYNALLQQKPELIDTIYGKTGTAQRDAANRLARVSSYLSDAEAVANRSGTGLMNTIMGILNGDYSSLTVQRSATNAVGALTLPWATGYLMRNPRFVKWLAESETFRPSDFGGLATHLGRLTAIEFGDDKSKQAAQLIRDFMSPELKRQQSLWGEQKNTTDIKAQSEAATMAKNILMMQDQVGKINRDATLTPSEKKKRAEPITNQINLNESRRNALLTQ